MDAEGEGDNVEVGEVPSAVERLEDVVDCVEEGPVASGEQARGVVLIDAQPDLIKRGFEGVFAQGVAYAGDRVDLADWVRLAQGPTDLAMGGDGVFEDVLPDLCWQVVESERCHYLAKLGDELLCQLELWIAAVVVALRVRRKTVWELGKDA